MIYLYIILTSLLTALVSALLQKLPFSTDKSPAKPLLLMHEGEIREKALKASGISFDLLMSRARKAGYFNLGDIDTAILETDGEISFLPTAMKRNLNPKDFNFAPAREGICKTVIENGAINEKNLKASGITKEELKKLLVEKGKNEKNILLATVNEAGRVVFFSK